MGTKPRLRRTKNEAGELYTDIVRDTIENIALSPEIKAQVETHTEHGPPCGHSLEYDVKKGQVVARPIFPGEIFVKPKSEPKPLPNWKLHLIIFLVALVIGSLIGFSLATRAHGAASEPPRIGRLTLPAPWWEIVKQVAQENDLDPCLIMAVMAIESRFYRYCINKKYKCYGLMQLQVDVCRKMNVTDPFDPDQNIRAGARILARLWRKYDGNIKGILKEYNPTDNGAYSREVIKAWNQARRTK
jgi:hypothetical protein